MKARDFAAILCRNLPRDRFSVAVCGIPRSAGRQCVTCICRRTLGNSHSISRDSSRRLTSDPESVVGRILEFISTSVVDCYSPLYGKERSRYVINNRRLMALCWVLYHSLISYTCDGTFHSHDSFGVTSSAFASLTFLLHLIYTASVSTAGVDGQHGSCRGETSMIFSYVPMKCELLPCSNPVLRSCSALPRGAGADYHFSCLGPARGQFS